MTAQAWTTEILLTLAVTAGALGLFIWDRLRVDVVALIVMATLILLGLVTPQQGISGFANEAVITVAAMFVLSAGLLRTGAIDLLGRWTGRIAGQSEFRLLLVALLLVVPLSAFINNTPVVVVMIPMVLGLARERGIAPSRLFMPISFASQMGGTTTLIGTSTNLLVAGLALELGLERIRLFDVTLPALVLTAIGVTYLLTISRVLMPSRTSPADPVHGHELRRFLSGLLVGPDAPIAGRSLRDAQFASRYGLQVVGIDRAGQRIPLPRGGTVVNAGDVLIVEGNIPDIARIAELDHLTLADTEPLFPAAPGAAAASPVIVPTKHNDQTAAGASRNGGGEAGTKAAPETPLAELMVPPRSPVVGRTLLELNFRNRFGVPVLGIQRHGEALSDRMRDVRLEPGDILLVSGGARELGNIHRSGDLVLLGAVRMPRQRLRKMRLAIGIVAGVVLLAAFEVTPILVSALLGVVAMFMTGCITADEAYEDIDWMVIVLLGAIIPLGIAMRDTGTAQLIAGLVVRGTQPLGPYGVLGTFYLVTSLLTEAISNNAAAVVLTPIAVATALALGVSPLPFVIAVMFAASNSFMTPIGYQTNTFIYGPGGYRFSDFLRVGGPLNFLLVIAATFTIPFFFPF